MHRYLALLAFIAGLAVIAWVGFGYIGAHPLALLVTLIVAAFYLMGAVELHRFRQATATLVQAVDGLSAAPSELGAWIASLHPSLRNAVRLRVEGQRVALPGPVMAPYLTGLLVLLGMLGTLLGMVATLNGTGAALASSTDLQSIRGALSRPVQGLGLAFGTSVAGLAASAMLGLMSAVYRRERAQAGQVLDAHIATTLRPFSATHQRETSLRLMQQQAEAVPALVEGLQATMVRLERQSQALAERLAASQSEFHAQAVAAYRTLAESVDRSLTRSLNDSAHAAAAAIQPVVEATMARIARETGALHDTLGQSVQRQLDGLASGFDRTTARVAETWQGALAAHQRSSQALSSDLRRAFDETAEQFGRRSAALVDGVAARLDRTAAHLSQGWGEALARQREAAGRMAADTQQALTAVTARLEQQAAGLLEGVGHAHRDLQTTLAARDEERLRAWTQSLHGMAAVLKQEWQDAGADNARRQAEVCDALARAAADVSAQTQAHAKATIAQIGQLAETAAQAPRAAAEVVAQLRQKLSDSMVRDNALLEERACILDTLGTLLDAVKHACADQRAAIDALVGASAEVLQQAGQRFAEAIDAQGERMAGVSAQLTGSAAEVASLGEAFGAAVGQFGSTSEQLAQSLRRIEGALDKSLARSDEQLAYYVAQAREVVDLSILSQQQIVEDLQHLASRQAAAVRA